MNIAGINLVALLNQVSVWWHIAIVAAVVVPDLPRRQAGPVRADAVRDPAAGHRRQLEQQPRRRQPRLRPGDQLPGHPRVLLLAAPGELDVHRLRRLGPRRRGDGRRPRGERVGRLPVGRRLGGRRLHLPARADDPPAEPVDAVPGRRSTTRRRTASTTSAAASPSSTSSNYNLGSTVGGILAAGIAIAMAFCGLSSVASAGRMLFAFSRDDGLPGSGWLKKVSHRYRTPANALIAIVVVAWLFIGRGVRRRRRGDGDRHRHRDQHDLPVRRLRRRASTSARRRASGSRSASGASAAGPSRSPGSPSSGSSS